MKTHRQARRTSTACHLAALLALAAASLQAAAADAGPAATRTTSASTATTAPPADAGKAAALAGKTPAKTPAKSTALAQAEELQRKFEVPTEGNASKLVVPPVLGIGQPVVGPVGPPPPPRGQKQAEPKGASR